MPEKGVGKSLFNELICILYAFVMRHVVFLVRQIIAIKVKRVIEIKDIQENPTNRDHHPIVFGKKFCSLSS
jgi:hypothetical protein